ncbi:squamous cell carcinoma antigen recognized by T-cells 3-like isoform X2 [Daktulosphaira vitifoliae]|nr:squamous cell carcinoma antigen recognized by T-cells 3-like isoform X2 [Daktulosphaira vitifoliae]
MAKSVEEKKYVMMLYERGVKDYLSIELWIQYIKFSIHSMIDIPQTETIRQLIEKALIAGSLHVTNGNALWEVYLEFEKLLLESLKQKSDIEAIKEQKHRINRLYCRQLSVPLSSMENTYSEYIKWLSFEGLNEIEVVKPDYKNAFTKLKEIQVFENSLLSAEVVNRTSSYIKYLNWEKNPKEGGNKLNRVVCLFERAIADLPLEFSLWVDYVNYVAITIKDADTVLNVCKRSVANCSLSVTLWCFYLVQAEAKLCSHEEINEIMENALCSRFSSAADYRSLYFNYIYYLRRKINNADPESRVKQIQNIRSFLEYAQTYLTSEFGYEGDPSCELLLWWSNFEACITGDMVRVRKIWNDILNVGHNYSSTYWMKYIDVEMKFGDSNHVRKLFNRALMTNTDSSEIISAEWIKYESLSGDLNCLLSCKKKINSRMKLVQKLRGKNQAKITSLIEQKEKKKKCKDNQQRKHEKYYSNEIFIRTHSKKEKTCYKYSPQLKSKIGEITLDKGGRFLEVEGKENRSVFVSNLDFAVTELEVKDAFSSIGYCEVLLIKDFRNRSKGFGYVLFESPEMTLEAIKRDRTFVNKRPMFVSKCEPDKQNRIGGLHFTTELEKNKLFIRGLSYSCTKIDLENIFNHYGALKDIRIVTFRNGHSKGLAYVEYNDEVSAAAALVKTNNMTIHNKKISVALSQPPERKYNPETKSNPLVSKLKSQAQNLNPFPICRDHARKKLSLLPSISHKSIQVTPLPISTWKENKTSLSNNDFRKMLLNT